MTGNLFIIDTVLEMQGDLNEKKGRKPWGMLLLEPLRPFAQELPLRQQSPRSLSR